MTQEHLESIAMTIELSPPQITRKEHAIIGGKPITFQNAQAKFVALAEARDEDNLGLSTSNYQNPAYVQIIGMGTAAIPMLLARLRKGERRWVYALRCIAGEKIETPEMRGNAEKGVEAWLLWDSMQ